MPDVVDLARALVSAFDAHGSAAMDPEVADAVQALRAEIDRIDRLLARGPDPESLDGQLLAAVARTKSR